ncbi:unknown protein [Simkania negevensis Z]|uniref:Uncharacterized protein n=1 Tax=Simkania negevensis (strain ATCC VR-1471 / DSM 27360 / Z) TaxID=331113 RepID=F8L8N9_SIMNZ|nr:unknown protein [Simkania negevensis Z]
MEKATENVQRKKNLEQIARGE